MKWNRIESNKTKKMQRNGRIGKAEELRRKKGGGRRKE